MTYLADVNVWVALAFAGHVHNAIAQQWFEETETERILFYGRTTQKGLLRLLTNSRVMGQNVRRRQKEAWDLYDAFYRDPRVTFTTEPSDMETAWREAHTLGFHTGPNFWTDAYLAAFAATAGFTILVTFDRGFRHHRNVRIRLLTA